jgi:hypothetical protein
MKKAKKGCANLVELSPPLTICLTPPTGHCIACMEEGEVAGDGSGGRVRAEEAGAVQGVPPWVGRAERKDKRCGLQSSLERPWKFESIILKSAHNQK